MATEYNINQQTYGRNGFGTQFSDTVVSASLAAATDTSYTVPGTLPAGALPAYTSNKYLAVFSYEDAADVWVNLGAAAAVPAGAAFAAGSELNPPARMVKAGDVIHMFCTAGADVSISLYSLQGA